MAEQIGINNLRLFPEYTRESYETQFGVQAPPFNPDKPEKTWLDPAGAGSYQQLVMTSNPPSFTPLVMNPADAKAVNLAGQYRYPLYDVPPTTAAMVWGNLRPLASASSLSSEAEANQLGQEFGVMPYIPPSSMTGITFIWGSETRRNWEVIVNGSRYNVQTLLQAKSLAGVGAPGKWVKDDVGSLAWESLPQPQPVAGNSVPVPVRTLAGDEEFASTPFGWVVRKKEMNTTPAGSGGDTAEILRLVLAIAKTLGIQ